MRVVVSHVCITCTYGKNSNSRSSIKLLLLLLLLCVVPAVPHYRCCCAACCCWWVPAGGGGARAVHSGTVFVPPFNGTLGRSVVRPFGRSLGRDHRPGRSVDVVGGLGAPSSLSPSLRWSRRRPNTNQEGYFHIMIHKDKHNSQLRRAYLPSDAKRHLFAGGRAAAPLHDAFLFAWEASPAHF